MTRKPKGLIFSAPSIRALRAVPPGKSQTRRLVKVQPEDFGGFGEPRWWMPDPRDIARPKDEEEYKTVAIERCPYGKPGSLVYAKEGWGVRTRFGDYFDVVYRADGADSEGREIQLRDWDGAEFEQAMRAMTHGWRSARFMPKWAARVWLEIVEVRCQRLQEISEEDARAEGVDPLIPGHGPVTLDELRSDPGMRTPSMYRNGFSYAWSELHDKPAEFGKSWRENPFVWAISFKSAEPPEEVPAC